MSPYASVNLNDIRIKLTQHIIVLTRGAICECMPLANPATAIAHARTRGGTKK